MYIAIWPLTIPKARRSRKLLRKITAPRREEAPTNSRGKIARSTGYIGHRGVFKLKNLGTTHFKTTVDVAISPKSNDKRARIKNQNLILFRRGNAISGATRIKGINQLPKPQ